ncbi:DUF2187 domain-containing protein [Bacillus shivajii]|uniref:KOW motif-containing protein n=1 Tax=Bacillus shivajii TaxID=1983719 RepID=UPI001CFA4555|nr:KOW motif-containing protein [Bacillus shivajii]UCZ55187.1 DUF2187 domain-containing protein [Bacillus shivajii]
MPEEKEEGRLDGIEVDDVVKVTKGEHKGQNVKIIAVYTNSVAVELNKKQDDGTVEKTILNYKEFTK